MPANGRGDLIWHLSGYCLSIIIIVVVVVVVVIVIVII